MKIREAQANALGDMVEKSFEDRVVSYLQGSFDDARLADPEFLRSGVREQAVRAEGYGLETEQEIVTYVVAAWILGADFDRRVVGMQEVLTSDRLPPATKAHFVRYRTERLVEQAEMGYLP